MSTPPNAVLTYCNATPPHTVATPPCAPPYGAISVADYASQFAAQYAAQYAMLQHSMQEVLRLRRCEPEGSRALMRMRRGEPVALADVLPHACEFATDKEGSQWLCRSTFPLAPLCGALQPDVRHLAQHRHGCRVVQMLLDRTDTATQVSLCSPLAGFVVPLVDCPSGNHVVQKVVERLPPHAAQFVVDEVVPELPRLLRHCFGIRVVQRILENCRPEQAAPLLDAVVKADALPALCREQYGNYVVQHVFEHGRPADREKIVDLVQRTGTSMCTHKWGSNVVEKAILMGNAAERAGIVDTLIGSGPGVRPVQRLAGERFANYVVQRLLEVAAPSQRQEVVNLLTAHAGQLRKQAHGKHVLRKLNLA